MTVLVKIVGHSLYAPMLARAAIEATKNGDGIGWDPKQVDDPSALTLITEWFEEKLKNQLVSVCIAYDDATNPITLLGSVQLIQHDCFHAAAAAHRGEISKLFVVPTARSQGIGRLLVTTAIEKARSKGMKSLTLDVRVTQLSARKLYRSLCFEQFGCCEDYAFTADGIVPGIYMALKL